MKNSASEMILECILNLLPHAVRVPNPSSTDENIHIIEWNDGNYDYVSTQIDVDLKLIEEVQSAIDNSYTEKLINYMARIKSYLVILAVNHDEGDVKDWELTCGVLTDPYLP